MKKKTNMLPFILIGAGLLFSAGAYGGSHLSILKSFIPSVEGFSAQPFWDYDQWSWGYGTAAGYDRNRKPAGSITPTRAMQDTIKVLTDHYDYLKPRVKKNLTAKQWAALLSFSYNLGTGNALNIVSTINTGTTAAVVERMKKYIYADGRILQGLVNRRKKETDLYQGIGAVGSYEIDMITEPGERIHWTRITDYAFAA